MADLLDALDAPELKGFVREQCVVLECVERASMDYFFSYKKPWCDMTMRVRTCKNHFGAQNISDALNDQCIVCGGNHHGLPCPRMVIT